MAQYAGARASTGRDADAWIIQELADRVRKIEMSYAQLSDVPDGATATVVLAGPDGQRWHVMVDEHGRLVAEDGASGARTVLAAGARDGGMV